MIILKNNYLTVEISKHGAEIKSIKDMDGTEFVLDDEKHWKYSVPHLFPVVGTLQNGELIHEGKHYPMPRHGIARTSEFDVISTTEKMAVFSLRYSDETQKAYPFMFELVVTYKINGKAILVQYHVRNLDDRKISFSLGAHPAFLAPRNQGEVFTDYFLEFETLEDLNLIPINQESGLLLRNRIPMAKNTKIINLEKTLFNGDALIFQGLKSKYLMLKNRKNSKMVRFDFSEFPFLGIWTTLGDSPMICIEPWAGHADYVDFYGEFCDKEDNISLEVGSEKSYQYVMEIM